LSPGAEGARLLTVREVAARLAVSTAVRVEQGGDAVAGEGSGRAVPGRRQAEGRVGGIAAGRWRELGQAVHGASDGPAPVRWRWRRTGGTTQ